MRGEGAGCRERLFAYNRPKMELKIFLSPSSLDFHLCLMVYGKKIHCQTPMEVQNAAYVPKSLGELT